MDPSGPQLLQGINSYLSDLKVEEEISDDDEMFFDKRLDHYFSVGKSAMRNILASVVSANKDPESIRRILDLPCGHGRVLRWLCAAFPESLITACDLNVDAVDYAKRAFHVEGVYSKNDPYEVMLDTKFDLIWSGSLLTHLNSWHFAQFLSWYHDQLADNGLLVFSVHGQKAIRNIRERGWTYGLDPHGMAMALREFEQTGFGYADYPGVTGYGITFSSPQYVITRIERLPDWRLVHFGESTWDNHHDVFACHKVAR